MKTQLLRLTKYLMDMHVSGRACVFFDIHGHVDQLSISIRESNKAYETVIYEDEFYFVNREGKDSWLSHIDKRDWKKYVDKIIEDIEFALSNREEKIAQQKASNEARERKRYEELKAKYEV